MSLFCASLLSLSLLSAAINPASATVSDSFRECSHFFYMQTPPAGVGGHDLKRICQRYAEEVRYATLYDSNHRLPIYSAYIFKKSDGRRRMDTPWMYEPQLVSGDESGQMRDLPLSKDSPRLIEGSQTVLEDYTDAVGYRRGPLNPDVHQADPDDKSSTYTLTNVVPLTADFLETSWEPYVDAIRRRINNFCQGKPFMVVGVTGAGSENRERLAIPDHVWLAYCCPRFDRNAPYEVRFMFPSYGGYALNGPTGNGVAEVPVKKLEAFLRTRADIFRDVTIFYKGCVSENPFRRRRKRHGVLETN